jgi:hypothetical protein
MIPTFLNVVTFMFMATFAWIHIVDSLRINCCCSSFVVCNLRGLLLELELALVIDASKLSNPL